MEKEPASILPLYHFFNQLRQNDFPLGIDDYQRFLYVLIKQFGIGISGYATMLTALDQRAALSSAHTAFPENSILRLCKLLWLKPNQSVQLFEELFKAAYSLDFAQLGIAKKTVQAEPHASKASIVADPAVSSDKSFIPEAPFDTSVSPSPTEEMPNEETSVRVAVGKRSSHPYLHIDKVGEIQVEKSKFLFTQNYFPIDKRKVQQNLRAFPKLRESHPTYQINIDATVQKIIEKGFFHGVVWKKHKSNTSHLLLLIDNGDAMVAFTQLSETLRKEIEGIFPQKNQKEKTLQVVYFYNLAADHFFVDKTHTEYVSISKLLHPLQIKQVAIIIISDAGAAYGGYYKDRVQSAHTLLAKLQTCTGKIAWLNPMPADRWKRTSSEVIARSVAMFEATDNGIKNAVDFLKGTNTKIIQRV